MIVAARDEGCLREVLVIAAALTVQDPRERPQERRGRPTRRTRSSPTRSRSSSPGSSSGTGTRKLEHKKSQRKLVEACHENFLSALRMREWRDIHSQLHALAAEHGWQENELPATYDAIHRALLAGLLGNIGCKSEDSGHYLGARGIKFLIHPGRRCRRRPASGSWRRDHRDDAPLRPLRRAHRTRVAGEGRRSPDQAQLLRPALGKEGDAGVAFERIDACTASSSIRAAGELRAAEPGRGARDLHPPGAGRRRGREEFARRWDFFTHNQQLMLDIETLEHKSRRPDVLVDDELIFAFYDRIIPEGIYNGAAFDKWRKRGRARDAATAAHLQREDLMRHEAAGVTTEAFPHQLKLGGVEFELAYHFEPGSAATA
jgi:ATP-dependent helicase HrpA